ASRHRPRPFPRARAPRHRNGDVGAVLALRSPGLTEPPRGAPGRETGRVRSRAARVLRGARPPRPARDRLERARSGGPDLPLGTALLGGDRGAPSHVSEKEIAMRRAAMLLLLPLAFACKRIEGPPALTKKEVEIARRPTVEWLREEPIRLLRDYIQIDTTLAHGEEEGARFLQRFFECENIETELICPSPKRCNLFARLPGRRREGALLLLNHIDVAPVTLAFWKIAPPF